MNKYPHTLWLALSVGVLSVVAPCCALAGTGFPTVVANGTRGSIGVVQLVVDPSFSFLFGPAPGGGYYPGYGGSSNNILTGPVMYDGNTIIGESVGHVRNSITPSYFPVAAGTGTGLNNYPPPFQSYSNILGYTDYSFIPPEFISGTDGTDEMMTEIEQLHLTGLVDTNGVGCGDPRVPAVHSGTGQPGGGNPIYVLAGPGSLGLPNLPFNRRSIGIVQQITNGAASDFPARSFFDVFVEVRMPSVPNTFSATAFPTITSGPGSGLQYAVLYNDASNPLLIQNPSVSTLPPDATYIHGLSSAVPVKFRDSNPPYWNAGDVVGYLTLAGHGVFTNIITAVAACPMATATGGLLDQTLGPVGSPIPAPPIPWLRPTNLFPTPNSTYGSLVNRPVDANSGQTNELDDTVSFIVPGLGLVVVRDLMLPVINSITPPGPFLDDVVQNGTTIGGGFGGQLSVQNGLNNPGFFPLDLGLINGFTMLITNTGTANPASYDTELREVLWVGVINGGDLSGTIVKIRESPTLPSLGKHTIGPDPRGYRISSFFDVWLELSLDQGNTWAMAEKPFRFTPSLPAALPMSLFVTKVFKQGSTMRMVLNWQNSFQLQQATSIKGPWTDIPGANAGPFTNSPSPAGERFFRLRQ